MGQKASVLCAEAAMGGHDSSAFCEDVVQLRKACCACPADPDSDTVKVDVDQIKKDFAKELAAIKTGEEFSTNRNTEASTRSSSQEANSRAEPFGPVAGRCNSRPSPDPDLPALPRACGQASRSVSPQRPNIRYFGNLEADRRLLHRGDSPGPVAAADERLLHRDSPAERLGDLWPVDYPVDQPVDYRTPRQKGWDTSGPPHQRESHSPVPAEEPHERSTPTRSRTPTRVDVEARQWRREEELRRHAEDERRVAEKRAQEVAAKADVERVLVDRWLGDNGFPRGGVNARQQTRWARVMQKATYPLHVAVAQSNARMVELLLRQGADTTLRDSSGKTPVVLAETIKEQGAPTHWDPTGAVSATGVLRQLRAAGGPAAAPSTPRAARAAGHDAEADPLEGRIGGPVGR